MTPEDDPAPAAVSRGQSCRWVREGGSRLSDPGAPASRGAQPAAVVGDGTAGRADFAEGDAWAVISAVDGLGPVGLGALVDAFGDGNAVLRAAAGPGGPRRLVEAAASRGHRLPPDVAARLADAAPRGPNFLARLQGLGVTAICLAEAAYPARLRLLELPPPVLFVAGDPAALCVEHPVAVVGTRRPTERGRRIAAAIAAAIARAGGVVVSGLAVGIDGVAHEATVAAGGRTVAVLGGGHARLYPRAHARLAGVIVEKGGAVVSELAPDVEPVAGTFPRRNRVISGLADATVVVEARARSGALITAGWALEQGRTCFAVPGPLDVEQSLGCNRLLRLYPGEVRAVATVEELVEDLDLAPEARPAGPASGAALGSSARPGPADGDGRSRTPASALPGSSFAAVLASLSGPERAVAGAVARRPATLDDLVAATGLAPAAVLVVLTRLEERGQVTAVLGRYGAAGALAGGPLVGPSSGRTA